VVSFADGADPGAPITVTGQAFFFQQNYDADVYTIITLVGLDTTNTLRYNVEVYSNTDTTTTNCDGVGLLYTASS
jgi:hypothetical protein